MTVAPTGEQELPTGRAARRRRARRAAGATVALAAVVGLGGGVLWLGTPTPLVTVMSPSMEPALGVGEIALMGTVRDTPKVGDIVQVPVPRDVQREKSYPSAVVHRIVEITDGRVVTQGDNLDAPDPFDVPISAVDRRLVTVVPGAGRVVSFVLSPFGLIWIGIGGFMLFGYPVIERNRERHQVETVETKAQLQHVAAAVADYGHHLKSHTEIVIAMSQAAQDLSAVASRLEGSIAPNAPTVARRARRAPLRAQPVSPVSSVSSVSSAPRRVPLRARPLVAAEPIDGADPSAAPAVAAPDVPGDRQADAVPDAAVEGSGDGAAAVAPRPGAARSSSSRSSSSRPSPSRRHPRTVAHVGWVVAAVAAGVTIGARHHAHGGRSARTRR